MVKLFRAEGFKLIHDKSFWGIALFSLLLSSLLLLDSQGHTKSLFYSSLYNTPLLYFSAIIWGALFVGEDFKERTLHSYLSAGHKRSHIFFAKAAVYALSSLLLLGLPLLLHTAAGCLVQKSPQLTSEHVFVDCAMIFLGIFAMCMFPLFCAFVFQDVGRTFAVPMVIFFVMIFLLNTPGAERLTRILPMGQLRLLSLGGQTAAEMLAWDILLAAVLYAGALLCFCRRDLK